MSKDASGIVGKDAGSGTGDMQGMDGMDGMLDLDVMVVTGDGGP